MITRKYARDSCRWIYDPEVGDLDGGTELGTTLEGIPDGWVYPICGVGKDMFSVVEE